MSTQPKSSYLIFAIVIICFLFVSMIGVYRGLLSTNSITPLTLPGILPISPTQRTVLAPEMRRFVDEAEFRSYLTEAVQMVPPFSMEASKNIRLGSQGAMRMSPQSVNDAVAIPPVADRYSKTNVQVVGVDEPDIFKTDGRALYAQSTLQFPMPILQRPFAIEDRIDRLPYPLQTPQTYIFDAQSPHAIAKLGQIPESGTMLLSRGVLTVIDTQKITAYAVDDPRNPVQKWHMQLHDGTGVISARMSKGAIYLITQRYLDSTTPCVIPLWKSGDQLREVHCTDIYHPVHDALTTQLLTISRINAFTGTVDATTSLTSQISGTTLYMNADRIYIAYPLPADQFSFLSDFLLKDGRILLTDAQATRIQKLQSYDLSAQTKLIELNSILSAISRIDKTDEGLLKQNKLQNAFDSYLSVHANDIQRSVLYAYDSDDLALRARGTVPGTLLNQFSMDEYAGHLRVATTIEPTVWIPGVQTNRQSVSQVSILDAQLQPVGTIGDLGKTERIYAVRFIGERGYVVTFRQTDPFYVLDLSVPTRPTMAGELKIPGYSGYLHPLSDGTILGIGMEGSRVKLAQFDVSDPRTPTERSKFILTDQYSGAVYDHHAFLYDAQKGIIFVPGDRGGYLFTHARGLNLEKAVAASNARRAHYVNDVIYILTADGIIAVDENTYETIGTYKFPIAPSPAPVLYDGLEIQKAR